MACQSVIGSLCALVAVVQAFAYGVDQSLPQPLQVVAAAGGTAQVGPLHKKECRLMALGRVLT